MDLRAVPFPAFGSRLRRLRRATGVKQAALADLLAVDQATVSRWERGGHAPSPEMQAAAFAILGPRPPGDDALRRLVEQSTACLHLVNEADHVCLAYSPSRAREWGTSGRAMLGTSLWPFATEEIERAEAALDAAGWWDAHLPAPRRFETSESVGGPIHIHAGAILWERLHLGDGTPVRLVSGTGAGARG